MKLARQKNSYAAMPLRRMITHSIRSRAIITIASVGVNLSGWQAAYARDDISSALDVLWSPLRTSAIARITVTCLQAPSQSGQISTTGSGFIVGRYYLLSARHVLMYCAEQNISVTTDLPSSDLQAATLSAIRNTKSVLIEYDSGASETVDYQQPIRLHALQGHDIGWLELRHLLKARPSLCVAHKLRFDPSERVSFYGFGSGGPGHGIVTTINIDEDQDHLAEAADAGGPGYSGSPVVDERGYVIGVVAGYQNGNGHAQFVALSWASNFLKESGWYPIGSLPENDLKSEDNHAECTVQTAQPVGYRNVTTIQVDGQWRGGGSDPTKECLASIAKLKASGSYQANATYDFVTQPEESRTTDLLHVEYRYHCAVTIRSEPVYPFRRDKSCPLRDPVTDPLHCDD